MKKSLYKEDGRYSLEALRLKDTLEATLKSILKEQVQRGYSFREVAHVMHNSVSNVELEQSYCDTIPVPHDESHTERASPPSDWEYGDQSVS